MSSKINSQRLSEKKELIKKHLEELEKSRKESWNQFSKFSGVGTLCLVLSFSFLGILGFVSGCGLISFSIYRIYKKSIALNKRFKSQVLPTLLETITSTASYYPDDYIDEYTFEDSKIFERCGGLLNEYCSIDYFSGEDLIEGTYEDIPFKFSQIKAETLKPTGEKDDSGNELHKREDIFTGLFLVSEFNKPFEGTTFILPDHEELVIGFLSKTFQRLRERDGLELIKLENPEFEKYFKVYSSCQIESRFIITPKMMEIILMARDLFKSEISISMVSGNIYIAINYSSDILESSIFSSYLDPCLLDKCKKEFNLLFDLINIFDLEVKLWGDLPYD